LRLSRRISASGAMRGSMLPPGWLTV